MAKNLNKTRMRDTRILMALLMLTALVSTPALSEACPLLYNAMRFAGYVLLVACGIGRMHSTAFIGGVKNEKLMTVGPYSMHRNPLYFYSLLGAAGLGLLTGELIPALIVFLGFYFIYADLIAREEKYLQGKFGAEFDAFKASTPRLWPAFRKYKCPAELPFQPRFFNMAVKDAVWWFAPAPFLELVHYLHAHWLITPLFTVW